MNHGKQKSIINSIIHDSLFIIHPRKGFTLIELVVVIAIVGLLLSAILVIINPGEQLQRGRDTQRKRDLAQIQTALDAYHTDKNHYPDADISAQIYGAPWNSEWYPYMTKVPKDPIISQQYYYQVDQDKTWYRLYAKLERCPDPQTIPDSCSEDYNYSVTSSNQAEIAYSISLLTPTPTITPTLTLAPFKLVFVTSQTYTGDLKTAGAGTDGLDGGDKICKSLADNSTIASVRNRTWRAWLSDFTGGTNAVDRIPNAKYGLVDNTTVVADSKANLTDGTIDAPINKNENGVTVSSSPVWTGSNRNGILINACPSGWRDGINLTGWAGLTDQTDNRWTAASPTACHTLSRLYCFEI